MMESPWDAQSGILSGLEIAAQVAAKRIRIDPPLDSRRLNPASYDLLLGSKVAVYRNSVYFESNGSLAYPKDDADAQFYAYNGRHLHGPSGNGVLDSRKPSEVWNFEMNAETGWFLRPGVGYLMHTADRIGTDDFVPVLDGKSSLGRLFLTAHVTAGYGDPGFNGQYTLEVVVTQPVIVYPGMRFCQIRFHTMVGPRVDYAAQGHYVGKLAEGPVPSMSWKQFEEQEHGAK